MRQVKRQRGAHGRVLNAVMGVALLPLVAAMAGGKANADAVPVAAEPVPVDIGNTLGASLEGRVDVFVRLDVPSVVEMVNAAVRRGQGRPSPAAQRAQARKVARQQERVSADLKGLGAQVRSGLKVGANGLRVRVDAGDLDTIAGIDGVRSIARVPLYTPSLVDSIPWIGADTVQQDLGITGEDVTIAVIDTGVDYTHADFGGSGDPADFANNDPDIVEPGTFPTAKVIGGFDFVGTDFDASDPSNDTPQPDPDPLDENFHGTHVAGVAAGNGVPGKVGQGVAPDAKILALKVFGETGSTNVVSDAIEFALDPNQDGAIDDAVDVINMSLGSPLGDPNSASAIASQNASELGVIVVASAGNSGDVPYVTGSPAVAPDVISVAASQTGGRDVLALRVDSPASVAGLVEATEGAFTEPLANTGNISGDLVPTVPLDGCSAVSNGAAISGNLALIQRGACRFDLKVANAQAAGATGVVVFNNVAGPPIVMGGDGTGINIPGLMISLGDGQALFNTADGGTTVTATMGPDFTTPTGFGDFMADFSSRGPGHGGSTFKPDVTAPGVSILSAFFGTGTEAVASSGTSFSAPHVAGLSALLRQQHPDLAPVDIKSLMQTSSVSANIDGPGGSSPFPLTRQGVGSVRADRAAAATSFATPGGVSFGRINPFTDDVATAQVRVRNLSGDKRTFSISQESNRTFPGVSVEVVDGNSLTVAPNGKATMTLRLRMDPESGAFDSGFFSQTEVDGWIVLNDGTDELRVGYLATVDPASAINAHKSGDGTLSLRNNVGAPGFAEGFTLAGEGGLILDDAPNAIDALGVRSAGSLVELGIATEQPWESMSDVEVDIFIDADEDGTFETTLVAADLGVLTGADVDGRVVTAVFNANGGFLLFFANGDLNDRTASLPFFRSGTFGFLPAGDTTFDYQLVVFDTRNGSFDVQTGSVDLANEIGLNPSSAGLASGGSAEVTVSGAGEALWLFQNNAAADQVETVNLP